MPVQEERERQERVREEEARKKEAEHKRQEEEEAREQRRREEDEQRRVSSDSRPYVYKQGAMTAEEERGGRATTGQLRHSALL